MRSFACPPARPATPDAGVCPCPLQPCPCPGPAPGPFPLPAHSRLLSPARIPALIPPPPSPLLPSIIHLSFINNPSLPSRTGSNASSNDDAIYNYGTITSHGIDKQTNHRSIRRTCSYIHRQHVCTCIQTSLCIRGDCDVFIILPASPRRSRYHRLIARLGWSVDLI